VSSFDNLYNNMAMTELRKKLGQRIRELRKKHGYTQEDLADISGLNYKHIQSLESKDPHNPQLDTLEKLAKAFKISVSQLLKF
jgi:transcriptional regulator with XRE-family HTH domain